MDIYSYSCLHPLSNERKSMFKSRDSRAVWTWVWTWKYLKWALHYIRKALRTGLIISPVFLFAKTLHTDMTLWRRYDVRKYSADAILFREIQCKKLDNLMFQQRFQCEYGWNKVKYARITITHVCFMALTLAGSLGRCWTLGLSASCSNSILGTRQMVMHEKTCVIPIFTPIVYLAIQVACFDAIFDCVTNMIGRLFYLHIVKSTPYNQAWKRRGFLIFIFIL